MRGRSLIAGAVVAVALCSALCAGAPKVDIRVIPRPRPEEEASPVLLPVPSRDPFPAFQGPFVNELEALPCIREEREMQKGEAFTLDFCYLANVTIQARVEREVEVEVDVDAEVSELTEDGDAAIADLEDPVSEETEEPDIPVILGIFRGWHIDPITLTYKFMVFDDGDECMDNDHYSMVVELIPSSLPESETKFFGLKKTGMCTFKASLLTFVPEGDRIAAQGLHTPGVVDISDAKASLPVICGKMKCRYDGITKRIRYLSDQIRDIQETMDQGSLNANTLFTNMTLEASKNTLESATQILEKSLELFLDIENQQQSLANDFLGREEAARKEIAKQEAEDKKSENEVDNSDRLDKQDQVTATLSFRFQVLGMEHAEVQNNMYLRHQVEAQRATLFLRQEKLNNEVLRMRKQRLETARRERREVLRAQVQQLEQQVRHYELKSSPAKSSPDRLNKRIEAIFQTSPIARLDQRLPVGSESLVERLVQQNEQIMSLLLLRSQSDGDSVWKAPRSPFKRAERDISDKPAVSLDSPGKINADTPPKLERFSEQKDSSTATQPNTHDKTPPRSFATTFHTPASWLPEFEWTDEDEMTLNKFESDEATAVPGTAKDDSVNNPKDRELSANTASAKAKTSSEEKC